MDIDFSKEDIRKILIEKFGKANFKVFYIESDREWEARNNKKISELKEPPEKQSYILYFNEG